MFVTPVFGAVLVVTGLIDVFVSVLAYDLRGPLTERLYPLVWRAFRLIAQAAPQRLAAPVRALAAPSMVVITITIWAGFQIMGFALIFWPWVDRSTFPSDSVGHSFGAALYLSTAAISSVSASFGEQAHDFPHLLLPVESLIGLGLLTLALTYLLGVYSVVQQAAVNWVMLQQLAGRDHRSPHSLLVLFIAGDSADDLSQLWRRLHDNLSTYLEGMRRYPVAYYFHTRTRQRSLPYLLWFVAETAAPVRWATPDDAPERNNVWLLGLLAGVADAIPDIERLCSRRVAREGRESVERGHDLHHNASVEKTEFRDLVDALAQRVPRWQKGEIARPDQRFEEWSRVTRQSRVMIQALSADFGVPFEPASPNFEV